MIKTKLSQKKKNQTKRNPRPHLKYNFSIRGRTNEATTYSDGEMIYFLNMIEDRHDTKLQVNPLDKKFDFDTYLKSFIAYFCAIELHELGHGFNYRVGCNHGKQKKEGKELCPWCEEVMKVYGWLI